MKYDYSYNKKEFARVERTVKSIDEYVKVEVDISYTRDLKTTTYVFSGTPWSQVNILEILESLYFLSGDRTYRFA